MHSFMYSIVPIPKLNLYHDVYVCESIHRFMDHCCRMICRQRHAFETQFGIWGNSPLKKREQKKKESKRHHQVVSRSFAQEYMNRKERGSTKTE